MSHSTHVGFNVPPTCTGKGWINSLPFAEDPLPRITFASVFASRVVGVLHTAAFKGRLFRLNCEDPALFAASCPVGVGHIFAATCKLVTV